MRLAGQQKAGYYPAPMAAIEAAAALVAVDEADAPYITALDPCAGRGEAIASLRAALGIPEENVYACELDINRAAAAAASMPKANVLQSCDWRSTEVSRGAMSLAWVNPPYDDELNGGMREEETFFDKSIRCLRPGGVAIMALPEPVLMSNGHLQNALMSQCEQLTLMRWPQDKRRYNEMFVVGVRRSERVEGNKCNWRGETHWFNRDRGHDPIRIPRGAHPKVFKKGGFTDLELAIAMRDSPSNALLAPLRPRPSPKPGLQLGAGQRALILAGGFLNRALTKNGETIVIKASPYKEQFVKEQTEVETRAKNGNCEVKTKTVYSERICLRVRVLVQEGVIHDLK